MKKILCSFIGLLTLAAGTVSFFDSGANISEYHSDGIDDLDKMNFTANPPAARTGAPFETTCTDCHVGAINPAAGTVDFDVAGITGGYYFDSTYAVSISSSVGTKNGFQLTVVDPTELAAGDLTAGANSNTTFLSGREYIRQTSAVGSTSWTFDWTSPSADVGDITFYYAYNITNSSATTAGDTIYVGSLTVSSVVDVGISKNEELEVAYELTYMSESQSVMARYSVPDNNHIVFHVQDLSGRVVKRLDLGYQLAGEHQETFDLNEARTEGIYLVSIFIGNRVFTKKLYVGN